MHSEPAGPQGREAALPMFLQGPDMKPTCCARVAAIASLLLGVTVLLELVDLARAAPYVAVLAGAAAATMVGGGYALWRSAGPLARALTAVAAGSLLGGELLQALVGLPGVRGLPGLTVREGVVPLGLALAVLGLLVVDTRRRPEEPPSHPYAL